jgi:hypothetical protein
VFTKKSYLVRCSMAFKPKWASYGHNHGIVCSNDLILCTYVYLGMTNNIDLGSFNFCCTKKSFFIFLVQKLGFFVKCLPKICYKNWTTKFYKTLYHILCTIHQFFCMEKVLYPPLKKRQNSTDSAGSGSNLNYMCFIICSWFFPKIVFRYKSIYFIRDPQRVLQDSVPT